MEKILWGFDIGGTKCAVCAADEKGTMLSRVEVKTNEYGRDWKGMLDRLTGEAVAAFPKPVATGVSCGGPLNSGRGVIMSPPNLPGWDDVPVKSILEEKLGVPSRLMNDANACAYAEWKYGAGRGTNNMIFLTFGTGFGAGLILDGKLYEGPHGMAGEVGHLRMAEDGPLGYGKRGSLEGFCSGGGLANLSEMRLGRRLSAKELACGADNGDEGCIAVLNESAAMLGRGLAILIDLFDPEVIVIGSIFARAERHFRSEMQRLIDQEALEINRAGCRVLPAALGDRIGDMAAIAAALDAWEESLK